MKDFTEIKPNMIDILGIKVLKLNDGLVEASMLVTQNNCQIAGFLCGGASIAMAEILAGIGSLKIIDDKHFPLGQNVTANHVRAVPLGNTVYATANLLHQGQTIHLWNIDLNNEQGKLVSSIRVTNQIVLKR